MVTGRLSDEQMAGEVALDLPDGSYVNLGIGLPTMVADWLPAEREVVLHSENGVLGLGPAPPAGEEDWDLIDAGKHPATLVVGGSYISHADSFCVIRGAHLDVAVLGAFEVSARGDLANWSTGGGLPAVGGAMDLAVGAKSVWALTRHTTRAGTPKLVAECSLPLTGRGVVSRVYTDLGIFAVCDGTFVARGLAAGATLDDVRRCTSAPVGLAGRCCPLPRPGPAAHSGAR
jgi:3-oxoadipate CoA-transferase beta subunit